MLKENSRAHINMVKLHKKAFDIEKREDVKETRKHKNDNVHNQSSKRT